MTRFSLFKMERRKSVMSPSAPSQRIRSATGPTGNFPGWKPSPEIAARWRKLTEPRDESNNLLIISRRIHTRKVCKSCYKDFGKFEILLCR